LFENLFLAAFIDSYQRIGKSSTLEGKIRDMFIADFEQLNPMTRDLIKDKILILNWERWMNAPGDAKTRADISFAISGFEFIIECKRLKSADSKYIDEGIKRFVQLKYAESDSYAGMMGFVIGGDIGRIVETLKAKIKDFHYTAGFESLLGKNCLNWKHSFQSRHNRDNDVPIHLYHLFFDFIQPG
jgi:hypothetical protein